MTCPNCGTTNQAGTRVAESRATLEHLGARPLVELVDRLTASAGAVPAAPVGAQ